MKRRTPVFIAITKSDNKEVLPLTIERATDELERLLYYHFTHDVMYHIECLCMI